MNTKRFLIVLAAFILLSTVAVFEIRESHTLESRVESLYEEHYAEKYSDIAVVSEITNSIFNEVFPQTHMYKIALYPYPIVCDQTIGGEPCYTPDYVSLVIRESKDYLMPDDFNRLMLDAEYELNEETRDTLVHALGIAALPTEMAEQSVLCGEGYEIDEGLHGIHYTYAVDCQVGTVGDVSVWFWPFDDHFTAGLVSWGNITEHGWREFGQEFSVYPAIP